MRQKIFFALVLGLAAAPAMAQDRPAMIPNRDVAVTYRMVGSEHFGAQQMQIAWLAAQGLQRMDMGNGQGWMVSDVRNNRGFMVMERDRMVMDMADIGARGGPQVLRLSDAARITREGSATLAGHACTVWKVEDQGRQSRACITSDGVMLRVLGQNPANPNVESGLEAVQVSYGPKDPARFSRPAGFQAMQLPSGLPPGMMGGITGGPPPGQKR
jgi:hypothetical protein